MRYLVALETTEHRRDVDAVRIHRWTRGRIAVMNKREADKLSELINQHRISVFGHTHETVAKVCVQVHTSRGSTILDHDTVEDLVQDYTTSPDYQSDNDEKAA